MRHVAVTVHAQKIAFDMAVWPLFFCVYGMGQTDLRVACLLQLIAHDCCFQGLHFKGNLPSALMSFFRQPDPQKLMNFAICNVRLIVGYLVSKKPGTIKPQLLKDTGRWMRSHHVGNTCSFPRERERKKKVICHMPPCHRSMELLLSPWCVHRCLRRHIPIHISSCFRTNSNQSNNHLFPCPPNPPHAPTFSQTQMCDSISEPGPSGANPQHTYIMLSPSKPPPTSNTPFSAAPHMHVCLCACVCAVGLFHAPLRNSPRPVPFYRLP